MRTPFFQQHIYARTGIGAAVALAAILLALSGPQIGMGAPSGRPAVAAAALTPLISYQGRLLNPTTGAPLNGSYTFVFRLYNVASDGAALWTETKDLTVTNGLFSTLLGDTTALPTAIFSGQDLWLGIKVGADAEATPRQRIGTVAYALYSDNADQLDGQDSTFFRDATNINAGALADAHIPAVITRDSEVLSLLTAADGAGSGLDADQLDGQDSAAFAAASHGHTGTDIVDGAIGTADLADNAVTLAKIADGSVATDKLADGAVTAAKITTAAVGDAQIQDRTRVLSFPASVLSFEPTSTIIKQTATGLDWQANFSSPAFLSIVKPDDWDGTSNVQLTIHFHPTTSTAGNVDFFIRPRAYNVGNTFADTTSLSSTPVAVSGASIINQQVFSIPASRFGNRDLWVITIQNQASGATYPDTTRVLAISLAYNAVR